jgi:uncharacterized protein
VLTIDNVSGDIVLQTSGVNDESLVLIFSHVASASKDFRVRLNKITEDQYRGSLINTISGNWNMSLESEQGWQITGRLDLTASNRLNFTP